MLDPPTNTMALPKGTAMGAVLCAMGLARCLHITPSFCQVPPAAQNSLGGGGGAELGAGLTNVSCWQVTLEKPASDSRLKSSSPIQEALPQRPGDRELGLGQPLHSLVHEVCHRQ